MTLDKKEQRGGDSNRLWEKMGEHGGRIGILEAAKYQGEQAIVNHRHETNSHIEKIETKVEQLFDKITKDIFTPLLDRVGRIEKFMYVSMGAGFLGGTLLTVIINWDNIKHFFSGAK